MLELTVWQVLVILKQATTRDFPNTPVTPCLGNSYDTVEYITAWKVIPKQAATRHIPKYNLVSHPVSVVAMTHLNL